MAFSKVKSMKFQKIAQGSDSDDDDSYDLSKPMFPLSHYVDDEAELVSQMFTSLKFKKIKAMLPPVLRAAPMADIQKLFVQELTGMSRTRILASINGEEVNTSSSDSDISGSEMDMSGDVSEVEAKVDPYSWNATLKPASDDFEPKLEVAVGSNLADEELDTKGDVSSLTTLDLIELEMRAKLIKTMLEKQPNEDLDETAESLLHIKIKEEPMSPQLLTGKIKKEIITPRNSTSGSSSSSISDRSGRSSRKLSRSSIRGSRSNSGSSSNSSRMSPKRHSPGSSSSSGRESLKRSRSPSSTSSSDDSTKMNSADDGKGKRKLTRKEFEERMKKAKMNRSYRKRDDSDEDTYSDEEDDDSKTKKYKRWKARMQKKLDEKAAKWQREYFEGLKKEAKEKKSKELKGDNEATEEVEEGEVLEKEEGELESNEDIEMAAEEPVVEEELEEGACTPSDHENNEVEEGIRSKYDQEEQKKESSQSPAAEKISSYSETVSRRNRKSRKSRRQKTPDDTNPSDNDAQTEDYVEIQSPPDESDVAVSTDENSMNEANMTLPSKNERQSISFSLTKKKVSTVQGEEGSDEDRENDELNDAHSKFLLHFTPTENIEIIGEEDSSINESGDVEDTLAAVVSQTNTPEVPETADRDVSLKQEKATGGSGENSCDSNIDIIGVIEPTGAKKDSDSFDEELNAGASWSSRWLQSEMVQTVVSDSKIMSKVRKKIQAKGKIEKPVVYSAPPQPVPQPVEVHRPAKPTKVIGSIEEYEKIIGVKVPKKSAVVRKLPPGLDSGDSEDSEEEALWSQIMKK